MEKKLLAQGLRTRQNTIGTFPKHLIDSLSDNDIIDAYITCSCCLNKFLSPKELEDAVGRSSNVENFLDLTPKRRHRCG